MKNECDHESFTKLEFLRPGVSGVHGPYYEIWLVRCNECGQEFEQSLEVGAQ